MLEFKNSTISENVKKSNLIKTTAMCAGLLLGASANISATDISDYQQTYEKGLFGDVGNGSEFDLSSNGVEYPGDKITSVKMYFTKKTIEGIEVRYRFGETAVIGRTTTDKTRTMHLDDDEYITKWKFTKRKSDEISRVYLETNKGFRKKFGEGNVKGQTSDALPCGQQGLCDYTTAVIGFYGNYNGDAIQSLGVVSNKVLELEEVGTRLGEFTGGSEQSGFLSSNVGANGTGTEQSSQIRTTYTKSNTLTDKWSDTHGITATLGYSTTTKANVVGAGEISATYSLSVSASVSNTIGQDTQVGETESITVVNDLRVAPYKVYAYNVVTYHATGEQEYITTYRNTYDGAEFDFPGKVEAKTYTDNFIQWLDVGYVEQSTGDIVIYQQYKNAYGHYDSSSYNVAPTSQDNEEDIGNLVASEPRSFDFDNNDHGNSVSIRNKANRNNKLFKGNKFKKLKAFKNKSGRVVSSINGLRIGLDDPDWVMGEAEKQFRRFHHLN